SSQLAQVTLRSTCGQALLDELLAEREKINTRIQEILDAQTEPWGIKVVLVEVKDIDLPPDMQRAMAKQADAERERRAKVIHAEGEFKASQKLADAAEIIAKHPAAMHLRFLQSLVEVSAENNSTVVVPVPVDLLRRFLCEGTAVAWRRASVRSRVGRHLFSSGSRSRQMTSETDNLRTIST